jgi:hypothetical protein
MRILMINSDQDCYCELLLNQKKSRYLKQKDAYNSVNLNLTNREVGVNFKISQAYKISD